MLAVSITPGRASSARIVEVPDPGRRAGECLVRVLDVGIDGTDREIDAGEYGDAPAGEKALILGHESLGEVIAPADGAGPREGELVVATVRRPCPERCRNCRAGEPDFCLTGNYTERGIKGQHGFLAETYAERPEFLIPVPRELRRVGVLLEPVSIVEKVLRQVDLIQRRMCWEPRLLLVTGAGSIGVLTALLARLRGLDAVVYSRGAPEAAPDAILRAVGAQYVDSERHSLGDVAHTFGPPDVAVEATGFSPLAWEVTEMLDRNGIACLLSVTGGERAAQVPSDRLNRQIVLGNQTIFGSVNAHRRDFEQGIIDLRAMSERWPGLLDQLITARRPLDAVREVLDGDDELKTVIEVVRGGDG